jgi:hypothetical protein
MQRYKPEKEEPADQVSGDPCRGSEGDRLLEEERPSDDEVFAEGPLPGAGSSVLRRISSEVCCQERPSI